MMLDTLRRIAQEVGAATNLDEALTIIVGGVRQSMAVDVCSVYLTDGVQGDHVLTATDGLNPSAVGKVRLGRDEGLVGLVGERREPVNLANAAEHPRYRYFPETAEERYHGFLGVPIIHYRQVLGVLVVQQREARLFDADEVALLVSLAAQLAGAISDGRRGSEAGGLAGGHTPLSGLIKGVPGAPGVAIGTVVLASPFAELDAIPDRICDDIEAEEAAFRAAVAAVQEELRASGEQMAGLLPAEARAVFDVYVMLLGNDRLINDSVARIHAGSWAPAALRDTVAEHAQVFEQMEDSYLQARAEDIRAIGRRILIRLRASTRTPITYPERCILVGDEVSVARIAEVPVERLAGIVSMRGSVLSHTALVARALGIPAVMGVGHLPIGWLEGSELVVDGYQGRVFTRPTPAILSEFRRLVREEEELSVGLQELRDLPAETRDGVRVRLYANSGLLSDIQPALERGAEGIGLYRTEFPFMVRESFPREDEQYGIYRRLLEAFAPKPVIMRTLDVGGDKELPYFFAEAEKNPFLGWRGIRVTLDHPEIFRTQLRAMLRVNAEFGNLQVLLPMISRLREVEDALSLIEQVHRELQDQGQASVRPPVGAMIEVPSAVYLAAALARRLDFLSIGTNDLTQYLLAVDRNNARVANLYDSLHPVVINAVRQVVEAAHRWHKPVSLCGEMAGDPAAAILLLGMGIDAFSMSASSLPRIKWVVRSLTQARAQELLEKVLELHDECAIRRLLNSTLEQAGLGGLIRGGR